MGHHTHCLGQLFPWCSGIKRGLKAHVGQFGLVGSLIAGFSSSPPFAVKDWRYQTSGTCGPDSQLEPNRAKKKKKDSWAEPCSWWDALAPMGMPLLLVGYPNPWGCPHPELFSLGGPPPCSRAHSHRGEAVPLRDLRHTLPAPADPQKSPSNPHRRETISCE